MNKHPLQLPTSTWFLTLAVGHGRSHSSFVTFLKALQARNMMLEQTNHVGSSFDGQTESAATY